MGTLETFDHTADVGFRVAAETLDDLFVTAAEGLFGYVVVNLEDVRPSESEAVSLSADTTADLLVTWLNELIFRCETRHRLYANFDVHLSEDGLKLAASIAGEPIDPDRHILDHEVKAVTQHGLSLTHSDNRWVAELILDI
ncbi:MAG: hypothetical protein JWN86_2220 [Planctomycetota bacterium]|nr:hypothetical protein [Planctomycetota bacterium]